ncbi:hypothetical protein PG993_010208 [Apiospora rasikravindrae]|uniref:Uncharacterized protein n=1 Tax=Apiospora rasikravindrae TaxID=990691 RepID=A0ABR1SLL4_9PEZI
MNYAAMIEEKNLKKTFIIATLCSTLVGTFTSSIGLWDRVKERRQQTKRDTDQDKEIKELRKQVEDAGKQQNGRNNQNQQQNQQHQYQHQQRRCCSSGSRHGSRHRSPSPPRRRRREEDVAYALERSGALIGREFDEGYERLGRRFAIGDSVTENRLQAQVIALQQTVINVLQDALYNGRQLDNADMSKLIAASNAARDGSLDALRQQRQRQTLAIEAPPAPAVPMPPPAVSFAEPRRASTSLTAADPLYCRYSLDLQYVRDKPLARTFAPGGDCRCPGCGIRLCAESDDFWEIEKRARGRPREGRRGRSSSEAVLDEREFHVGQRFVVKCHTPDGEFACVLCSRFRDRDVICPTVDQLINHVGRDHTIDEMEREDDFEMRSRIRPLRKALPAP